MTTFTDNGGNVWTGSDGAAWVCGGQAWGPGAQAAAEAYANSILSLPPVNAPVTTIPALAFIQRWTSVEQASLMAANPLWGVEIAAAGTVDVTSPALLAALAAAVSANVVTQARVNQVLNLLVASP